MKKIEDNNTLKFDFRAHDSALKDGDTCNCRILELGSYQLRKTTSVKWNLWKIYVLHILPFMIREDSHWSTNPFMFYQVVYESSEA
ncbi:unnamed protein product [Brassica oleracea]